MLALVLALTLVLEEFIEHVKTQFGIHGDLIHLVKYAAGIGLAFGFNLTLFAAAGLDAVVWVDKLLTGLAIGAGSSFINAAIERLAGDTNRWSG